MDYFLIFRWSLLGLVISFCTVYFLPVKAEPFVWLIVYLMYGYIVADRTEKYRFLVGFLFGFLANLWTIFVYSIKYKEYLANHVEMKAWISNLQQFANPYYTFLITKGIIGVLSSVIPGSFALIISKAILFFKK